jgi:hypothetical protein
MKRFLGISVVQDFANGLIVISATDYEKNIIKEFGLESDIDYPPCDLPVNPSFILSKASCPNDSEKLLTEFINLKIKYQKAIGRISYLVDKVRHDGAPALGIVNQFSHNPGWDHWAAVVRLIRYFKATLGLALIYRRVSEDKFVLRAYADSNLATPCSSLANSLEDFLSSARSRTGGAIFLGNCLVKVSSTDKCLILYSTR